MKGKKLIATSIVAAVGISALGQALVEKKKNIQTQRYSAFKLAQGPMTPQLPSPRKPPKGRLA